MRVLVLGNGGREHALAWKLSMSPLVTDLYAIPGNPGIARVASIEDVSDPVGIAKWARDNQIDLTVVGPEYLLSVGIADIFAEYGLKLFGPSKEAATLESSKVFSKELMRKYGIPTAGFAVFSRFDEAKQYLEGKDCPLVIKADGLAGGKGVVVAKNKAEAISALQSIMIDRVFGEAGNFVVIEDFLEGKEVSVFALVNGDKVIPLVDARDYKAAYDGGEGPNTGGMGAYSPVEEYTDELSRRVYEEILEPTALGMVNEGRPFRGILYAGLMISPEGDPYVLEYNVRFGDPEAEVVLPRLKSDLLEAIIALMDGRTVELEWEGSCVGVVLVSKGYPKEYEVGYPIKGLERVQDVLVFHAGTAMKEGELVTAGGRVLVVSALGKDREEARQKAYEAVSLIEFVGMEFRSDIGRI